MCKMSLIFSYVLDLPCCCSMVMTYISRDSVSAAATWPTIDMKVVLANAGHWSLRCSRADRFKIKEILGKRCFNV